MVVLELQKGIIYGPVASRRLGRSLGINLSPTSVKYCSFDCIYCHYGRTPAATASREYDKFLPTPTEVTAALEDALARLGAPDYITFSGNGEPTYHPAFAEVAAGVREVRDRRAPASKLAILSNAGGVGDPRVREGLGLFDVRIMKLDAGTPALFKLINCPAPGVRFEDIITGLADLEPFTMQTCFVAGEPTNTTGNLVADYLAVVTRIAPARAQVYTIDRPVGTRGISKVSRERLEEIARRLREEAGVETDVF